MSEGIDVGDAENRFAELLERAANGHERFLIHKRGAPVAAIVSTEDLARLSNESGPETRQSRGLIAAIGIMADAPDWERFVDEAYRRRQGSEDRPASLDLD